MKIQNGKIYFWLFLFFLACSGVLYSQVKADLQIEHKVFSVRESPRMTVTVSWQGKADKYLIMNPKIISARNITLTPLTGHHETTISGNVVYFPYRLEAQKPGKASTGEIRIPFRRKDSEKQQKVLSPVELNVLASSAAPWVWGIAGAAAVMILAAALLIFCLRRIDRSEETSGETAGQKKESDYLEAFNKARQLSVTGDYKCFYAETACLLLTCLQEKYNIKEFDREILEEKLNKRYAKIIFEILETAREVRFGGYKPEKRDVERTTEFMDEFFEAGRKNNKINKNNIQLREESSWERT